MSTIKETMEKMTLPIIALRGLVVFPRVATSFEVTRKKSIAALNYAQNDNNLVFVVTQKEIKTEDPKLEDLYKVGVIAKVKQTLRLPDKQYRIIIEGLDRGEIMTLEDTQHGLFGSILKKRVEITDNGGVKGEALVKNAVASFMEYSKFFPKLSRDVMVAIQAIKDPGFLADFMSVNVLYKIEDKQEILNEYDPLRRMELLSLVLERESEVLKLEAEIDKKVKARVDKTQREYYLKEQLRVLQGELGQKDEYSSDYEELSQKIISAKLGETVTKSLLDEASKLEHMPFGSAEASLIRNHIEVCLSIPFNKYTKEKLDLSLAEKVLDRDHDGLTKVKERIIEYLAVRKLTDAQKGQIICLVGPPGVGKTSICASIAKALGRNYVRLSLGGVRDEADIRGHRKTYIGAMPGRIINAIKQAKSMNPLIVLDEIDKLTHDAHGDPASALLEVLDSEQNFAFRDHFVELPVDLTKCIFISTANTTSTIPKALLDRMEVIHISGYTQSEKIGIAKNHLIPKQLKLHGLTKKNLDINEAALVEIIEYYTKEQGVRELERQIAKLCRKTAKSIVDKKSSRICVRALSLTELLGKHKYKKEGISEIAEIGIVNGLAWTEVGGEMLKVEVISASGSGKLILTGNLGDVMKESAQAAVSLIRKNADVFGIENKEFYKNLDIHIHFPEGAVPKDGPSAGIAITTALISELSGRAVRSDVAMTGEITLRGKVLAIGGLREKTAAAYANGIKTIIIPNDNLDSLDEVADEVKAKLVFVAAKDIFDVIKTALVEKEEKKEINYEVDALSSQIRAETGA